MNYTNNKNFFQALVIVFAGLTSVLLATFLANKFRDPQEVVLSPDFEETIKANPIISCKKDFASFEKLYKEKKVFLIDEKKYVNVSDGFINDINVIVKRTGDTSRVVCGYLYVVAGVNDRPLQQKWENVVINPDAFGGHIISDKSLVTKTSDNLTEMLFSLDKIYYRDTKDRQEPIEVADWVSLLNVSSQINFNLYVNTISSYGFIKEVSIAYKCWNPETGEETDDCNLEIEE